MLFPKNYFRKDKNVVTIALIQMKYNEITTALLQK